VPSCRGGKGERVDFPNVRGFSEAVYTGLKSDELERLPETSMIHHATPVDIRATSSSPGFLLTRGARSLCDQPMTLVMPRLFDLADPHACSRCLEALANGRGGQDPASS
jgi:hypothetical protein